MTDEQQEAQAAYMTALFDDQDAYNRYLNRQTEYRKASRVCALALQAYKDADIENRKTRAALQVARKAYEALSEEVNL